MKIIILLLITILNLCSIYSQSRVPNTILKKDLNEQYQTQLQAKNEFPNDPISLDNYFTNYISTYHVPGIAVGIIKNDSLCWEGYYGYANLSTKAPVTDSTIFNLASTSKTIMVTALMQLYEKGYFQLDDSINTYLPFPVRNPTYPEVPITFKMLLTHTSSIQDNWDIIDLLYFPGDPMIPLSTFLQDYLAPGGKYYNASKNFYTHAPGTYSYYSNIGAALAGYLVEELTRIPFNEYCKDSIFVPLQMSHTAWFLKDLDTSLVAHPYSNSYQDYGLYGYPDYPDGLLRTTLPSLAKFLLMNMQSGEFEGVHILDSNTISLMRTVYITNEMLIKYFKLGLIWFKYNDLWGHTGGDYGVTTAMFLRENDNTGIIFLTNGENHPWRDAVNILFNYAHLYGNIYAISQSVINLYANKQVDSVLFRTKFSNINNHPFSSHLIYVNSDSTEIDSLALYDDGLHGDSLANDEIYGGYIPVQEKEDSYSIGVSTIDSQTNKYFYTPDIAKFTIKIIDGIDNEGLKDLKFNLAQNYPNPFNPSTKIQYAVSSRQLVTLKIYDLLGREIETLVNEEKPAGVYEINWNALKLSSGVYFYQLKAGEFIQTKKMILLK
jgi:CubicO group peptidase (beta-lactamase class C family)